MTVHPEIHHIDKDERIRQIAYAIWEEEGWPEGRADQHWLRACELVEAEAPGGAGEPGWLKRNEPVAAAPEPAAEPKIPLTEAIKRMRNPQAA